MCCAHYKCVLTISVLRLILNTAGVLEVNVNCWKMEAWMNALHCTHFACSTVTFKPLSLMKQVAVYRKVFLDQESGWHMPTSIKATVLRMEDKFLALSSFATRM